MYKARQPVNESAQSRSCLFILGLYLTKHANFSERNFYAPVLSDRSEQSYVLRGLQKGNVCRVCICIWGWGINGVWEGKSNNLYLIKSKTVHEYIINIRKWTLKAFYLLLVPLIGKYSFICIATRITNTSIFQLKKGSLKGDFSLKSRNKYPKSPLKTGSAQAQNKESESPPTASG